MALKSIDDVDEDVFNDEISSTEDCLSCQTF